MSDIKEINENIYGSKDSWYSIKNGEHITKIPVFSNGGSSFNDGVVSGQLKLNEKIDSSPCLFGISGDCDLLCNNAVIWNKDTELKRINERHDTGQILYLSSNKNSGPSYYEDLEFFTRDTLNTIRWSPEATRPEKPSFILNTSIALDFTYNQTIALIMVACKSNDSPNIKRYSLNSYITKYKDTYPIICGIYPRFYKGSLTSRTTDTYGIKVPIPYTQYPAYTTENYLQITTGLISYAYSASLMGIGLIERNSLIHATPYKDSLIQYFNGSLERWELQEINDLGTKKYVTVFKGTIDDIYKQASYWGVYFTDNNESAESATLGENCTDENVYLPVIEEGVLKGQYKRGAETTTLFNSKMTEDVRTNGGYKGFDSIDPTVYTDKISLSTPKIKAEGKFNTLYALSDTELNSLSDELWTADENKIQQILKGLLLMGENPLNCIVSLQLFPFDITSRAGSATQGNITLGATQMNTTGTKVKNLNSIIDIGSVKLRQHYNNFFDFEPYSTAFIYVPYCGTIQLSLNDVIGKTVSVKLLIDYISGVCTAVVFSDGIPVIYKNGCISQQIAITGTDTATMASNAISSSLGLLTNTTNLIAGGKDVSSVINNSANLLSSSFDYSAKRTIYQTQGANTSQINMCEPQKAYIVLNLPKFDIADEYSSFHGYRCDFYDTVKNLSGYTETDLPNLTGISATEEERQMLSEIMTGGFYV